MRIQHNIMAMNAYRNLSVNNSGLSKNLEKLASGYRINRAGDDAAGLAISEKMRAQIAGLDQAQKNAQSGINLVQTAEGALTEVHDMLNRMTTLATQAANGTYEKGDREKLQAEVNALVEEIDRIADNSNFNGTKLLDGGLSDYKVVTDASKSVIGKALQAGVAATANVLEGTDGKDKTAAAKAEIEINFGATTFALGTNGQSINLTSATFGDLGAMTVAVVNSVTQKVSDLFDLVDASGTTVAWNTSSAISTYGNGDETFKLVAKTPGALKGAVLSQLEGATGADSLDVADGAAEGGSVPTKAKYELTFDWTKVADGQSFVINGKTFELTTDGTVNDASAITIDLGNLNMTTAGGSVSVDQWAAASAVYNAISTALGNDFKLVADLTNAPSNNSTTIKLTAVTAGASVTGTAGGVQVSAANSAITSKYVAGTNGGVGQAGTNATVTYELDLSKLAVGDKLTISGQTIEIVKDADADSTKGKYKLSDLKNATQMGTAFDATQAGVTFADAGGGKVKVTITDNNVGRTKNELAADTTMGQVSMTASEATDLGGTETVEQGLTLQIGSSSAETITVKVGSMKASALGIEGLDISSSATAANKAIDTIKNAIQTVSTTRGDLGAIQNRLEHTINNLGVMEENIQDAEANIRDTDVADEMMAYTKNNILIQSAQAMLAQANQTPQGVLQLMQ